MSEPPNPLHALARRLAARIAAQEVKRIAAAQKITHEEAAAIVERLTELTERDMEWVKGRPNL